MQPKLEMFASTQDPEFVQGQSRDVPDHELRPNIYIITKVEKNICQCQMGLFYYSIKKALYLP